MGSDPRDTETKSNRGPAPLPEPTLVETSGDSPESPVLVYATVSRPDDSSCKQ